MRVQCRFKQVGTHTILSITIFSEGFVPNKYQNFRSSMLYSVNEHMYFYTYRKYRNVYKNMARKEMIIKYNPM